MPNTKVKLRITHDYYTNEYQVLVDIYKGGAYRRHEPGTYFTDDRADAIGTRDLMMKEYREQGYDVVLV